MKSWQAWLPLSLTLLSIGAQAGELGAVTLLEGGAKLLRGATWYKVATGTRVEESDILDVGEGSQAQVEFVAREVVNFVGPATIYFAPPPSKASDPPTALVVATGWLKVVSKPPGLQLRTPALNVTVVDAIVVLHLAKTVTELFVEHGDARMVEVAANGSDGPLHDLKRGEYWTRNASGALSTQSRAPKIFVGQMPRHFIDPLPALAGRMKSPPAPVPDHEITFAEAEPWLAGRDRAVFERRFASRLRDPAFRKEVMPVAARYPTWDRILNPQKYEPKKTADKVEPNKAPAPAAAK